MFKNGAECEKGVSKQYVQNRRGKGLSLAERFHLRRQGATLNRPTHKMDRKIRACYPRGKAFLKIVDLHTAQWLSGDGRVR
ncbi:hypothetical protein DN730_09790 [Marinomonas piezotolerans]|uniref:Uncharacterized protein n=1 Tax=Marinomonas piezotolerans TaxID=2213058 RepID=A0A370UA57_9GAMM|nr:hypothetical protein [Marinomonas piezotolerans]RDL44667.1 hypothetical protein DN730_09790 [Marinomonas piezotolerans]